MIKIFKYLLNLVGVDVNQIKEWGIRLQGHDIIYNVNHARHTRRCLMIYITKPFYLRKIPLSHQNFWQAKEMARLIGEQGYIVDVIDYQDKHIILKYNYDMVAGLIPRGVDVFSSHMKPGCLRIAYLTSMNLEYTYNAEIKRLAELEMRRGVKLQPRRFAGYIQKEIEQFDAAWYIGNEYNFHSYDCFKMPPTFYIKNCGYSFSWAQSDCIKDPKIFLFFGSAGAVHKGLDLLLELFSEEITDCTLYVCGGYILEQDFCNFYHKELFDTPNIISMGFVNIESDIYRELSSKCTFSILPSCAEGCAGSVLTNMSSGIIPIVSKECGFEDDKVINLPDCNKETIKEYVRFYSCKDQKWIKKNSKRAINIVRDHYSKQNFSNSVEEALLAINKKQR